MPGLVEILRASLFVYSLGGNKLLHVRFASDAKVERLLHRSVGRPDEDDHFREPRMTDYRLRDEALSIQQLKRVQLARYVSQEAQRSVVVQPKQPTISITK